jgi:hypothetical protein
MLGNLEFSAEKVLKKRFPNKVRGKFREILYSAENITRKISPILNIFTKNCF